MIWNSLRSLRYISIPLFLVRPTTENYDITHKRTFHTQEILTRKWGPTKYPWEKFFDPLNTHEGTMALDPQDPQ